MARRTRVLSIAAALAAGGWTGASPATSADEEQVMAVTQAICDAFRLGDLPALEQLLAPAVVQGITSLKGLSGGKPFALDVRFTDTLVRSDGRWRIVVSHVTRIGLAGARARKTLASVYGESSMPVRYKMAHRQRFRSRSCPRFASSVCPPIDSLPSSVSRPKRSTRSAPAA